MLCRNCIHSEYAARGLSRRRIASASVRPVRPCARHAIAREITEVRGAPEQTRFSSDWVKESDTRRKKHCATSKDEGMPLSIKEMEGMVKAAEHRAQIHLAPPPCPATLSAASGPCIYRPNPGVHGCIPENEVFIPHILGGPHQDCCDGLTPKPSVLAPGHTVLKCMKR